ncbi:hypothetical protein SS50377_23976 [Spironucleus salmonicida]|uniref:Uncharacterized protein n=1 Tax=Spironucleus salmonicida TaxID=348837 RepID=V6LEH4_9EUKA|nr:hypothetical protein SS50377_23976 [Spironucleus salmonicida]|eukprot:EST42915.1 Hypothetical protein SS50377_17450 [Spironucleus salmonicida]
MHGRTIKRTYQCTALRNMEPSGVIYATPGSKPEHQRPCATSTRKQVEQMQRQQLHKTPSQTQYNAFCRVWDAND